MVLVADDLTAWLVALLADAGRKKLTYWVLGTEQQRALRQAAEAAAERTAEQLAPAGGEQAEQMAMVVGEVFREPTLDAAVARQATLLEALQEGIVGKLAILDDPDITGTGQSSAELLGVPGRVLAGTLAGHLVREITVRGSRGGPLASLAGQLNHDLTHLQAQQQLGKLDQLADRVMALAPTGGTEAPRKPVRLLPRPAFLAGREELLAELNARLTGDGSGPRIVNLCGLGGAGKTSVAVEYACRHLAELEVAWQFAAEDSTVLAAGFAELAAQLGERGLGDVRDPVASVHAVLAKYPAPWLLIFDNATDLAAVTAFLPPGAAGRVLITSQNPNWPGQVMDVPVLDPDAAADFLASRTGDRHPQEARDLANELGGLPLALEQAAAYILATGDTLAGYLALFRQRRAEVLARGEPTGYGKTVASTWTLAFDHLGQTSPRAVGLLRLLAFYAPEAIPLRLLLQSRPGVAGQLSAEIAPVLVPLLEDSLVARDAIGELRKYSLVTFADGGSASMHRLVQGVTADRMSTNLARDWRQAAGALIEAAIPDDPELPGTWPEYAALLPHARAVLDLSSGGMSRIAQYLGHSGSYTVARDLCQLLVDAHQDADAFSPEHLTTRNYLARWTGRAGDAAGARDQLTALLPIRERVLGAEHPDTLTTRGNLAGWTGMAGDRAGARDQFAALLPIRERVLGAEHPQVLITRNSLAHWAGWAGDGAGARDQLAALLPIRERVLGAEHPDTLSTRHNLALWTGNEGDTAGARDQMAALLPIRERVLGAEHPDTLTTRASLAHWTGEAGDPAEARDQFAAVLPISERVLGAEHRDTLSKRRNLAYWARQAENGTGSRVD